MKTNIARAVVVGALLTAGAAQAQGFETYRPRQSLYIFNYEVASGIGSMSDNFVSATSWRGFSFEGRSMVADRISAGIGFTYNRFEQTHSNVVMAAGNGGTLSGPVYRYNDQLAVKGLVHAYLLRGPIQPYLGVGLGGVWSYAYAQSADLGQADSDFEFIASPEVGLTFTAAHGASSVGLNLAFRYNYTTADFLRVNDAQSLVVAIGLFGAY
jgi:hypothetical protein